MHHYPSFLIASIVCRLFAIFARVCFSLRAELPSVRACVFAPRLSSPHCCPYHCHFSRPRQSIAVPVGVECLVSSGGLCLYGRADSPECDAVAGHL